MSMLFRMNQPEALVDELIAALPEHLFESSTTTFCDPAMGKGDYLVGVAKRLIKYGHTRDNVLSRLYGYEMSQLYINNCLRKTHLKGAQLEVMTYDKVVAGGIKMKFDCIIGNPPYQNPNPKAQSLWPLFVQRAYELADHVALVIPVRWCAHSYNIKKGRVKLMNTIIKHHATHLNIAECSRHFEAGFTPRYFSYIILDTTKNITSTKITSPESSFVADISDSSQLPYNMTTRLTFAIASKIEHIAASNGGFLFKEKSKYQSDGHTRVVVGVGRFVPYAKMPVRYDQGELTKTVKLSHVSYVCDVADDSTDEGVKSYFRSKLVKFYLHIYDPKDTYSPSMFQMLPTVTLNTEWTNAELYAHFNLTQEEIDLIEATV